MKLNFLHLCDYAFISEAGKLNLIGLFKVINIQRFPGGVIKFHLVGSLRTPKDIFGESKLETRLFKNGKAVSDIRIPPLKFVVPRNKDREYIDISFNLEIANYKFKSPGQYSFVVLFEGKDVGNISFDVLQSTQGSN